MGQSVTQPVKQRWITRSLLSTSFFLTSFFLTPVMLAAILGQAERAIAQSLPICDPPRADEYLLLVRNPNADTQNQLRQLLPSSAVLTDCLYDSNPVVRVEGFVSAEIANAWAQYLSNSAGLQAIVARPPAVAANSPATPSTPSAASATEANSTANSGANSTASAATNFPSPTITPSQPAPANPPSTPTPPAQPAPATANSPANNSANNPASNPANNPAPAQPTATAAQTAFNPQPLGTGYAVVVNYFNRPEVALDVQQITSREVGLVAFEQRPYLLAAYTPDPAAASAVLRSLTERGLTASIVDSRRAILLTPSVAR